MSYSAAVRAISYYLPEEELDNRRIAEEFPEWSVEKIAQKTGIDSRHISADGEFASDLAEKAAQRLFKEWGINPSSVEFIILCTQSPDYFLPTTACLVQDALGIPTTAGSIDVNLGCSGYVYSLGLAKGMIESGQVQNVLVLTTDTYTKFLNPKDKSVRTIFGDGASATFVGGIEGKNMISPGYFRTDGRGAGALVVPHGGLRDSAEMAPKAEPAERGLERTEFDLYMDGPAIFTFTIEEVPKALEETLERGGKTFDEIDSFVFHQANAFMLEHLRKKIGIPEDKFVVDLADTGNTVSSTIPIALRRAIDSGQVGAESPTVLILGFGVGLSWAGSILDIGHLLPVSQ